MRVSLIGLFTKDLTDKLPTSWGELVSFCNDIDEITSSDHVRLQQHIKSILDERSVLPVPLLELRNALAELQSSIDANNCEEITQALFVRAYSLIINKIQNELRSFLKIKRENNAPFPDSELDYTIHDDHMAAKIMWNYILLIERIKQNININFYDVIGKDTQVVRLHKYLRDGEFSEKFTKLHDESSPFFQSFLTLQCITTVYATQLYNNTSKKYTSLLVAEKLLAAFNVGEPAYMLQKFSMEFVWKQIYSQRTLAETQLKSDLKQLTPFHKSKSVTLHEIGPIPSPENEFERKAQALHKTTALVAEQITLEEEASNIAKSASEIEKDSLPKIDMAIRQLTLLKEYLENSYPTLTSHTFTRVRIDAVTKKVTTELITNSLNQLISDLTNLRKQVKEKIAEAAPRAEKIKAELEKNNSEKAALTEELTQEIETEIKSKKQAEPEKEVKEVKQSEPAQVTETKKYEVDTFSISFNNKRAIKTPMDANPSEVRQLRIKQKDEHLDSPAASKSAPAPNDADKVHATVGDAPVDAVPFDPIVMALDNKLKEMLDDVPVKIISSPEIKDFSFKKKSSTRGLSLQELEDTLDEIERLGAEAAESTKQLQPTSDVSQKLEENKIVFVETTYHDEEDKEQQAESNQAEKLLTQLVRAASQPKKSQSFTQNLATTIETQALQDEKEKAEKLADQATRSAVVPPTQSKAIPTSVSQVSTVSDLLPVDESENPLALASLSRAYDVSDLMPVDENEEPIALAPSRAPQPLVVSKEDKIATLNKPTFWQLNGSSIVSSSTIILGTVGAAVAFSLAWPVFVIAIAIATILVLPIAAYLLTERLCGVKVEEPKSPGMFTSCSIHQRLGGEIVGITNDAEVTSTPPGAQQLPSEARVPAVPMPGLQV